FCWNVFFWFIYINVTVAAILETTNMLQTAADGSFLDLFTMMPCVGYLLVALAKTYKIKMNRSVFENLVFELRDMWPNELIPEDEYQVITKSLKQLKLLIGVPARILEVDGALPPCREEHVTVGPAPDIFPDVLELPLHQILHQTQSRNRECTCLCAHTCALYPA
ncbi:jg22844, partial [Pararge aegeria aegeria]